MLGWVALGSLILSLLVATWKLVELYQAYFHVGSAPWNAHQLALREELARFSSRTASAEEVNEFELKEQRYVRRLELQLTHAIFADEVERRRAEMYEQRRRLEATQTSAQVLERLKQDN